MFLLSHIFIAAFIGGVTLAIITVSYFYHIFLCENKVSVKGNKNGPQVSGIRQMMNRLSGYSSTEVCDADDNFCS